MSLFENEYKKLNKGQKEAVDSIDGPVMVVAGPGTGKTQVLTLRIANILKETDVEPEQILALTFTEAAAYNMRRRLKSLIGNSAYRIVINTFHGFCNSIIKKYPEDFPRIIGSKSITEVGQVSIVEKIIENDSSASRFVLLKPWGDRFLYVRDIVKAISDLKREGVTPEKFFDLVEIEKKNFEQIPDLYHDKGVHKGKMKGDYQKLERKILKNAELAEMYKKYQESLAIQKEYDFNDMILEVLSTLESNASLLQMLQEEHQYVLVDEHQDTNNAQNKILELLLSYHDNPNIFIVGDEKQAIFRFQGASLENFEYFKHKYGKVKSITLSENYRSTQNILDSAGKLLESVKLKKNSSHKEIPIKIGEFSNEATERYFIVHDIAEKIEKGVEPSEIAVLYRNNKDAFPIARDLARLGVPYEIESDQDLFTQRDVERLLMILKAIANYGDDLYITSLLHLSLFEIDPFDAYKVIRKANDAKKWTIYDFLQNEKLLKEINLSDTKVVLALGEKLKNWVKVSKQKDLLAFFEHIIRDSGILEDILRAPDSLERFLAIDAIFSEVQQLVEHNPSAKLTDFFIYLETIKKHNLFLKRKSISSNGGVKLMTVHKSKGQEFSHVYIIRAIDGILGGKIDRDRLPLIDSVYKLEK